jgi:hypothetical protein
MVARMLPITAPTAEVILVPIAECNHPHRHRTLTVW